MKFLTGKGITQKIIIAVVFVILFNFATPTISSAETSFGGILFEPIKDLVVAVSDAIVWFMQKTLFNVDTSLITLSNDMTEMGEGIGSLSGAAGGAAIGFAIGGPLGLVIGGFVGSYVGHKIANAMLPKTFQLPFYAISPEEIFENKIAALDVNFFQPNDYNLEDLYNRQLNITVKGGEGESEEENKEAQIEGISINPINDNGHNVTTSSAATLRGVISKWYYSLRNFAIVVLLCILVYTAIRIIISSTGKDKAKYKERLIDWLVAMCLLFFMHYMMAFAVELVEQITSAISTQNKKITINMPNLEGYRVLIPTEVPKKRAPVEGEEGYEEYKQRIIEAHNAMDTLSMQYQEEAALEEFGIPTSETVTKKILVNAEDFLKNSLNDMYKKDGEVSWPTNLMGVARFELQMEASNSENTLLRKFGYTLLYLGFVIYTVLFLFRYLKRLLMLAFLTMIAPLMAITYPLDKLRDGSAQGFNMWMKEYLFNLLIQPVHLILYTTLIGSAMDLVEQNMLYALVAFGFLLQAEKLLRKFFGFDKASTVEGGSALGGALAMQGLNHLGKMLGGGKKKRRKRRRKGQK